MIKKLLPAVLVGVLCFALVPSGHAGEVGQELLPNLKVRRGPYIQLDIEDDGPKRRLRFNTEVANRGVGPLELQPMHEEICTEPDVGDEGRVTYQRTFFDSDENGYFERDQDQESDEVSVGCVLYHPSHEHWHFQDFARYELFSIAPDGSLSLKAVKTADKVSFCMTDTAKLNRQIDGQPGSRHYFAIGSGGCVPEDQDPETGESGPFPPMGISVGWYDLYHYLMPGQFFRVDHLPKGRYCLVLTVDDADRLNEINENDNSRRLKFWMNDSGVNPKPGKPCDTSS